MKRLFVGIITALCAIAVTAQLVPYRQLSTNEFKVGSFPAVQLRLNPTQFNTGGFPITITNVTGVTGAGGGGGGSGNVVASGTNDVGWLLTASTNDGIHATWSAPIWTNSPNGTASLVSPKTNVLVGALEAYSDGMPVLNFQYPAVNWARVPNGNNSYSWMWTTDQITNRFGFIGIDNSGSVQFGVSTEADESKFVQFYLNYTDNPTPIAHFQSETPGFFTLEVDGDISDFGTITTGDPGSGTAAWKLGKNITGTTATVCVTNWVEVMIGTNVYHLLRANE